MDQYPEDREPSGFLWFGTVMGVVILFIALLIAPSVVFVLGLLAIGGFLGVWAYAIGSDERTERFNRIITQIKTRL